MSSSEAVTNLGYRLQMAVMYNEEVTASTPADLMNRFVNELADYIETEISYSGTFIGTTTSSPPTPITVPFIEGKLTLDSPVGTLRSIIPICKDPKGKNGKTEWNQWMDEIYAGIKTTTIKQTSVTQPLFTTPIFAFPGLTRTWERSELTNTEENVFDVIGDKIITDMSLAFARLVTYQAKLSTPDAQGADNIVGSVFNNVK